MKKICYCTTVSLTIRAFILKSAEYIHEHTDWDISVICSYDEELEKNLPSYIHYYPIDMKRGVSFDGLKAIREMKRIFKRERFDLIQYSTPNASLYASIAAKATKIPVRLYCQWGMVFVGFSGGKRKLFKKEEQLVCRNSTWIEPDSKSNLAFAQSEGLYPASKSSVVWNGSACGIDLEKFDITKKEEYRSAIREQFLIPEDAFIFIFVGRVKRDKGINELLSAYRNLLPDHPSYLFVLGGTELDASVDMDLYQWSKKENRIIYTGNTPVVEQYLAASDCYVLPSYREGFGMSVIEAQAMGVPVVVTDIPGPIDGMVDGETGIVVPKQDVPALQRAMEKMYIDVELRKQYGSQGYHHVKDSFDQKKFFEYILDDRKRLLGLK